MVGAAPKILPNQVVVLIPTLNENLHIEQTLHALLSDPYSKDIRFIIADGMSSDGTWERVSQLCQSIPNLQLVENKNRTQAHAMNLLLSDEFASYKIFIRCDAHAIYPPKFLSQLIETLEARADSASVVVPMDTISGETCLQTALALVTDTKLGAGGAAHRGGVVSSYVEHGHHAAFRAEIFREMGGYDTDFAVNEDAEFDIRLSNAGHLIWLEASARIGYFPRSTFKSLWLQYYRYGAGRAKTCLKHGKWPALRQTIPLLNFALLSISAVSVFFTALGWVWPFLYLALILGVSVFLLLKHQKQCALLVAPAVFVMHNAWALGFLIFTIKSLWQPKKNETAHD